jgi:hypothetical protein
MIRGGLFTRFFLEDGTRQTDAYRQQSAAEVGAFADAVRDRWAKLSRMAHSSRKLRQNSSIRFCTSWVGIACRSRNRDAAAAISPMDYCSCRRKRKTVRPTWHVNPTVSATVSRDI